MTAALPAVTLDRVTAAFTTATPYARRALTAAAPYALCGPRTSCRHALTTSARREHPAPGSTTEGAPDDQLTAQPPAPAELAAHPPTQEASAEDAAAPTYLGSQGGVADDRESACRPGR
jgi:hypothetical protein